MRQRKFWEAVRVCNRFAKMSHEDRELFWEMREKLRDRRKRYSEVKALLGNKITVELAQKINVRLEMNANAYSVLKDALFRNDSDEEIFKEIRSIVFSFENGEANVLLHELTEMERFYPLPTIDGNLDDNQLDTANVPVIRTINGGEYVCRSANPSVGSEVRYSCENIFNALQGMEKEERR